MKVFTLLFVATLIACQPKAEPISAPTQSLIGERAGDFLMLYAAAFDDHPQFWQISDSAASLIFLFEPSKKTLEVKSARFEFVDFEKCAIWLGPFSDEMAAAETSLFPDFPIFPPPEPFLSDCEKAGLQFLAMPSAATSDSLVFTLSDEFWEAWETGCLDWPWSVHFQIFVKGE